ncbi:MAG: PBP1A family penicillin-binding protein [Sporomusaceae bacterium]|nr:PBP1A family penicillin-binding protein [Sporomusaceae bacterium]
MKNAGGIKQALGRVRLLSAVLLLVCFTVSGCASLGLPPTDSLDDLRFVEATQVFDINGQLISKLFEENRIVVPISRINPYIYQAIIANEDTRFYQHFGVDPIGILRAVVVNLRRGEVAEGGSTITQQLARNMFLNQEQTLTRKLREAVLALMIERRFSKQEILQAYLNQVYFGEGTYGVEAASQMYFGKHAADLSLAESALLAGLPRGPNLYSPYVDAGAAQKRRGVVLSGMAAAGFISAEEAKAANAEAVVTAGKKRRTVQASYFLDYIANELVGRYGANQVFKGGLTIHTTLDIKAQQIAETVLGEQQGAVLILDPRNGHIRAMVGGRNYQESQINRVLNEVRQPGSAFKPFVYATALNQGLTQNTLFVDEPVNIAGYQPKNYDKKNIGPVTMKKALRLSLNTVAVKLANQVGIRPAIDLARQLGVSTLTDADNNLSTALGGLTEGVNLMELTAAYSAFANGGVYSRPIAILKVTAKNGQVLEENQPLQTAVLSPETAYLLTDMLQSVIQSGTGRAAAIGRPAAGKTGTADETVTAWFIGYTPEWLAGIYVGNDRRTAIGLTGGEVAAMWGQMMNKVTADSAAADFTRPASIVSGIPICAESGKVPIGRCKEIEYDAFIRGTEPKNILGPLLAPFLTPDTPDASAPDGTEPKPPAQPKRKWKFPWF